MKELPQRELRNNISAVLRAAESGERYVVTVDGRPVAELGPRRPPQWVGPGDVRTVLATPTDPGLLDDVAAQQIEHGLDEDPWTRG
ncbi:MAG: type II toxin-antitoxin system prevent-host-death family antitoxin [Egibacteraceae bacterium]